jgi:hypothetical protein
MRDRRLLNTVSLQVGIGLGKFLKLGFPINIRFGYLKTAKPLGNVGDNLLDPVNFRQIASDRSGTSASRHVGHAELDQRERTVRGRASPAAGGLVDLVCTSRNGHCQGSG